MKIQVSFLALFLALVVWMQPAVVRAADEAEIVATLERISGPVNVMHQDDTKVINGRNGLLLKSGDTVSTGPQGQATIKFRDGSELRVFPNTTFRVDQIKESQAKSRNFRYNMNMKLGAVWGNFARQRQSVEIKTPTATIGIKGTTLRVAERNDHAQVSLTEGAIDVSNDKGTLALTPGKQLTTFSRKDDLAGKVQDIPLKLTLKADVDKLTFDKGQAAQAKVIIQLVDVKRGENAARSGPIYLRSNYDRVNFPAQVTLDDKGYARMTLTFDAPQPSDAALEGNIYVWAVMDRESDADVGEGRLLFSFPST